ncbi:MAG TPA: CsbD family protein [Solirubrobacterales bacterium]|nr:CsbD family protein [Solirubrobacterales bacterium]
MTDRKVDEAKGRAKQAAGSLTDNKELKNEGKADQTASSVKEKFEHAVDAVKERLTGGKK